MCNNIKKNNSTNNKVATAAKPAERIIIDLQYLNADQARSLIKMFDSAEGYAEKFSAIKAITRGMVNILHNTDQKPTTQILRIFNVVNSIQDTLMLDDMQECERIFNSSGLMPDPVNRFRSQEGGKSCV